MGSGSEGIIDRAQGNHAGVAGDLTREPFGIGALMGRQQRLQQTEIVGDLRRKALGIRLEGGVAAAERPLTGRAADPDPDAVERYEPLEIHVVRKSGMAADNDRSVERAVFAYHDVAPVRSTKTTSTRWPSLIRPRRPDLETRTTVRPLQNANCGAMVDGDPVELTLGVGRRSAAREAVRPPRDELGRCRHEPALGSVLGVQTTPSGNALG
jgi:hypothetical protein